MSDELPPPAPQEGGTPTERRGGRYWTYEHGAGADRGVVDAPVERIADAGEDRPVKDDGRTETKDGK